MQVVRAILSELYESVVVCLLATLVALASMRIQTIAHDVRNGRFDRRIRQRLGQWQRSYYAVFDFVNAVNAFFGPALIVLITKFSMMLILMTFKIVVQYKKNMISLSPIVQTARYVILLSMIIIGAQHMKNQVSVYPSS